MEEADDAELEQEAAWVLEQAFTCRPISYQVCGVFLPDISIPSSYLVSYIWLQNVNLFVLYEKK